MDATKQSWEVDILYWLVRKRNLTSFYTLDLFQTITANVAIETKIFNDDALFEGAICQDFRLTLCTVVCKRLRKCGSCHIVSRNV